MISHIATFATIFFSMILVNNYVLVQFLGICPFLGVSKKLDSSVGMGAAVIVVMVIATAVTFPLQIFLLDAYDLGYLQTIIFILVIAVLVQLIEITLRKYIPALYQSLGVYLPLITTNCCVLGVTILAVQDYSSVVAEYGFGLAFAEALICSAGAGVGFLVAMLLFCGVRSRVENSNPPESFKGLPITLVSAAITSLSFMGLVTKRALVDENGVMEWIDGNIGSRLTMKYPCCVLKGDNSKGTCITISVASKTQEQDSGARMIHLGKNTTSNIISKSIAQSGGNSTYRGKVRITKGATGSSAMVKCDTLILDSISKSDTIPVNICENESSNIEHEATVSKISEDNLYYMMSRGISEERATELIVLGFLDKFRQELPMEYAVELNQLIKRNL